MSRQLVKDVTALLGSGWRPFAGTVSLAVYAALPCGRSRTTDTEQAPLCGDARQPSSEDSPAAEEAAVKKHKKPSPYWFFCGDAYLCLGCACRCALTRPAGFQQHLELRYNTQREKYTLSPQEMVRRLNQLTAEQAAYCLNISRNQVYHWIREGKLPRSRTELVRIPVSAVRALLEEREDE